MTKRDVLEAMHDAAGGWSNAYAARHFGVPEAHAGAVMCRLYQQRLIDRGYGPDGRLISWITPRGVARVAYWRARDAADAAEEDKPEDVGEGAVDEDPAGGPSTCPR